MDRLYVVEYGQDIKAAARFELQNFAETLGFGIIFDRDGVSVISGYGDSLRESAFIQRISEVVSEGDSYQQFSSYAIDEGKFYVRVRDPIGCHNSALEPEIGKLLHGEGRISFRDPDFVLRAFHLDRWYLAREIYSMPKESFDQRRSPKRPFFSPISMHPKIARFMVNVSNTPPLGVLLDPFCGTGGILLEAGLLGKRTIGIDLSLQMTSGAKLNLKYFGIRDATIINGNFLDMEISQKVDSIVTDMPYGRNAPMHKQQLKELYKASIVKFSEILASGKRCVLAVSDLDLLEGCENFFVTIGIIEHRIHKSLTRHYVILQRS